MVKKRKFEKKVEKKGEKKEIPAEVIEKAKKEFERTIKDLELLEKEKQLKERFLEIAIKGVEVLQPKFRYERTAEYMNLKIDDLKFSFESWMCKVYEPQKEFLMNKIRDYIKFFEDNGVEIWQKEKLKRMKIL